MAGKGGKGYSPPSKSSLKSTPAKDGMSAGKDNSSSKSKRGRKVQFNTEGSPDLNFNFPSSKADGKHATPKGKGGKGEKGAGRTATATAKEARPPELKVEQELPKNVKCLMDCEAATILQGIQEQMVFLSADPSIKLPVSFDRGLQYAKAGCQFTNPQSVRRALEVLTKHGVSYGEICIIANVCPETVDEALALIPSLKAKKTELSEPLREALDELAELKKTT